MVRGNLYRHKNCIDIDLYIHSIIHIGKDSFKARVSYWHRHSKYFIITDQVVIKKKDLINWRMV
jgi:hypothetical protein